MQSAPLVPSTPLAPPLLEMVLEKKKEIQWLEQSAARLYTTPNVPERYLLWHLLMDMLWALEEFGARLDSECEKLDPITATPRYLRVYAECIFSEHVALDLGVFGGSESAQRQKALRVAWRVWQLRVRSGEEITERVWRDMLTGIVRDIAGASPPTSKLILRLPEPLARMLNAAANGPLSNGVLNTAHGLITDTSLYALSWGCAYLTGDREEALSRLTALSRALEGNF